MEVLLDRLQLGLRAIGQRIAVHIQEHRDEVVVTHRCDEINHTALTKFFYGGFERGVAYLPGVEQLGPKAVLEAAVNGQADALVTYNVADFAAAGVRFNIPVPRPTDVLKKVKR